MARNANYITKEQWAKLIDEQRYPSGKWINVDEFLKVKDRYMGSTAWKEFRAKKLKTINYCEICSAKPSKGQY